VTTTSASASSMSRCGSPRNFATSTSSHPGKDQASTACRATRRRASSEWRMGINIERSRHQILPRPAGLAGGDDARRIVLSPHQGIAEGRIVRACVADQTIGRVNSRKYCRGAWSREHAKFHSVSADRAGIAERVGDAFAPGAAGWIGRSTEGRAANWTGRSLGKKAAHPYQVVAAEDCRAVMYYFRHSPFAIRLPTLL